MKTLFTAEASSLGGRSGTLRSPSRLLDITLGNPLEKGSEKLGPSPELLLAGAYAACYRGAFENAARKLGTPVAEATVRALVSLMEDDKEAYRLSVELHVKVPGTDPSLVLRLMKEAHATCPYSKALRGDASVKLIVDDGKPASGKSQAAPAGTAPTPTPTPTPRTGPLLVSTP